MSKVKLNKSVSVDVFYFMIFTLSIIVGVTLIEYMNTLVTFALNKDVTTVLFILTFTVISYKNIVFIDTK